MDKDTNSSPQLISLSRLAAQIGYTSTTRASLRILARERKIPLIVVRKVDLLTAEDAARLTDIYMKDHAPFDVLYNKKIRKQKAGKG